MGLDYGTHFAKFVAESPHSIISSEGGSCKFERNLWKDQPNNTELELIQSVSSEEILALKASSIAAHAESNGIIWKEKEIESVQDEVEQVKGGE